MVNKRGKRVKMFNEAITVNQQYIKTESLSHTTEPQDAENIQQTICLKIWQAATKARKITKAWITRITRTTIIDYNKKNEAYQHITTTENLETAYPTRKLQENPAINLRFKEQTAIIQQAEQSLLTPSQVQIITLYSQGYHYKEIATELHLTIHQVNGRLSRARKILRKAEDAR